MRGGYYDDAVLWASATGSEWTERSRGEDAPYVLVVGASGVVGAISERLMFTKDGVNWKSNRLEPNHSVVSLWREEKGFGGTVMGGCCSSPIMYYTIHSDDGLVWVPQRTEGPTPLSVAQLGDNWVGVSSDYPGTLLHRTSGATVWQQDPEARAGAVFEGADRFIAVGEGIWTSADGISWTAAELPAFD